MWLNKGSTIFLRWEADAGSLNQLEGMVIKGCYYFFVILFSLCYYSRI